MNTVLVTGAAGNIGSALVRALIKLGDYFVIGVDDLSTGARHKIPQSGHNFRFIRADVNKYSEVAEIFHSHRFDFVFHFAAVVGVQRTLLNPLSVLKDIDGIKYILSLSKNSGVRRVFFSSSSEVYGEPVSVPQNEVSTPLNSRLPYAIVKNVGEAFFRSYWDEHRLEYTIFRFFNTYGPNQSEDFVIPRFVKAALDSNPLSIYGDGLQTRTFLYVDDNIDTILACLQQNHFVNDVVNIGSDQEVTILDLARQIILEVGSESHIVRVPPLPEGDMTRRLPDIAKMRAVLQRPLVPLEEGIRRLIACYRPHEQSPGETY
jgi:UDP-glucuronate decarboxylase